MNQSQKTSNFLRAINKYAEEQSNAILQEVEEFKKQEIEKATSEAIADAYELIQKEISVKKAQIVSEYAIKEQNSKRELFIRRGEIVDAVFEKAKAGLIEYTNTDAYIDYIRKSAQEISDAFCGNECVVYIKEADEDKSDIIKGIIQKCTIEYDADIKIGGIKGYCKALSIIADNTLDSKLCAQREWFAQNSGIKVV